MASLGLSLGSHASPQSRKIGPVSGRIPVTTGPRLIHTEVFRDQLVLVPPLILQTSRREPVHVDYDHVVLNDIIRFISLRWLEQRISSSRIKRFMFFGRVYWLNCYPANYIYEDRTKLGMTKVVLRGSWGCHCCKTDRGPP